MPSLDLHSISKHEPVGKLPTYQLRRNILSLAADIDFYYIEKKKFGRVSDWDITGFAPGTLGHLLHQDFTEKGYHLIKNKEMHDTIHSLFDYDKDPEGEILLQAFLIGNGAAGGYTYPILLGSVLVLPEIIGALQREYKKGKQYLNVRHFNFHDHLGMQKDELLAMLKK